MPKNHRKVDISGLRFGGLTVVREHPERNKHGRVIWICRCDCGVEKPIAGSVLRKGEAVTCGCRRLQFGETNFKHGLTGSPEHQIWQAMIARCKGNTPKHFKTYKSRGIDVCERWRNSFASFLADMGPRPSARHSIDRVDNAGNYTPENCRWATPTEQSRNTRFARIWIVNGATYESLSEAAKAEGVSNATISYWCRGHERRGVKPRHGCRSYLRHPSAGTPADV